MIPKRAWFALVLILPACDQKSAAPNGAASVAPSAAVAPYPAPQAPPSIGVPECDQYFKLAFKCASRLPPEIRGKAESSIVANAPGWAALAQTPSNRADLVQQCTKVLEALQANSDCK